MRIRWRRDGQIAGRSMAQRHSRGLLTGLAEGDRLQEMAKQLFERRLGFRVCHKNSKEIAPKIGAMHMQQIDLRTNQYRYNIGLKIETIKNNRVGRQKALTICIASHGGAMQNQIPRPSPHRPPRQFATLTAEFEDLAELCLRAEQKIPDAKRLPWRRTCCIRSAQLSGKRRC